MRAAEARFDSTTKTPSTASQIASIAQSRAVAPGRAVSQSAPKPIVSNPTSSAVPASVSESVSQGTSASACRPAL